MIRYAANNAILWYCTKSVPNVTDKIGIFFQEVIAKYSQVCVIVNSHPLWDPVVNMAWSHLVLEPKFILQIGAICKTSTWPENWLAVTSPFQGEVTAN